MGSTAEVLQLAPPVTAEVIELPPSPERVREQLQRIIRSKTFQRAKRLRSLLEYVVCGALQGQMNCQAKTARDLFGKSEDFDPSLDPVIRVQFGRLRRTLTNYYAREGRTDAVVIDIPKRRYAPVFRNGRYSPADGLSNADGLAASSGQNGLDCALAAGQEKRDISGSAGRRVIAVLPFTNLTSDPAQDAFCHGLTEEIAHGLTSVESVDVMASSSAMQFRDEPVDVREAGRELGVPLILEGSVRIEEGHTRVIAQLARAEDGVAVWSDSFEDEMNGSLNTQKSIAQKVKTNLPLNGYGA